MTLPLDHIVIAVNDLQAAIDDYRSLGFTVNAGGEHPNGGTHNALVIFQDGAYLELIAWKTPNEQHIWWPRLQQSGPGIVDFALLPQPSTPHVVNEALVRGLAYHPPVDGGRLRPDGVELRWQNARPQSVDLPFLCGDVTPRTLRVPDHREVREHANGATGVERLHVAVHDTAASLARYQALLGATGEARQEGDSIVLLLGGTELWLDPGSSSAAAAQRLASAGEGPYAFTLRAEPGATSGALDTTRTHGAQIHVGSAAQTDAALQGV